MARGFQGVEAKPTTRVMEFRGYERVVVSEEGVTSGPPDKHAGIESGKGRDRPATFPVRGFVENLRLATRLGRGPVVSPKIHGVVEQLRPQKGVRDGVKRTWALDRAWCKGSSFGQGVSHFISSSAHMGLFPCQPDGMVRRGVLECL
jgi:hypothetical protein